MNEYHDFGWSDARPTCAMDYVVPAVMSFLAPRPGMRVLDFGCGNGYLAGRLVEYGCDVLGVDASDSGIAQARAAVPDARFAVLEAGADLTRELGAGQFDAVVSTEVIEHLYAPGETLRECFEVLREGGVLIVSTPYHGYLKNLAIALAGRFDRHVDSSTRGGHIKFWSRSSLGTLLEEAGYVDQRFTGAGRLPYLWKSMVVGATRPRLAADEQEDSARSG